MKEFVLNINKVNLYSLPCIIIGTPLFIIVYKYFHGTGLREILDSNPYLLMVLVLVIFGMVILHELIHGVFFSLYAKRGTKSIKFGIMWSKFAPYCHCEDAITAKQYRIVLLMPTLLLGILPTLTGIVIGNFIIFFSGVMLIWGGIGDIIAYRLTRKVPDSALLVDHPKEVGFYYNDKI